METELLPTVALKCTLTKSVLPWVQILGTLTTTGFWIFIFQQETQIFNRWCPIGCTKIWAVRILRMSLCPPVPPIFKKATRFPLQISTTMVTKIYPWTWVGLTAEMPFTVRCFSIPARTTTTGYV